MGEIKQRNLRIAREYKLLRKGKGKISQLDAYDVLEQKYCLSIDTIRHIVWKGKS